jgi:hypothetical protein
MKIRSGFVSNSSSSSFIIAVNNVEKCSHCGRGDPDFIDFVEKMTTSTGCDDTQVYKTGAEEIKQYFTNEYGTWYESGKYNSTEEYVQAQYGDAFDEMEANELSGKRVAYISISYHDEITNNEFAKQVDSKAITKIYGGH